MSKNTVSKNKPATVKPLVSIASLVGEAIIIGVIVFLVFFK